jgi:hypothetical protein
MADKNEIKKAPKAKSKNEDIFSHKKYFPYKVGSAEIKSLS